MRTSHSCHWMLVLAVSVLVATASTGPELAQADPEVRLPLAFAAPGEAGSSCSVPADSAATGEWAAIREQLEKEAGASGRVLLNGHGNNYGSSSRVESELIGLEAALQAAK